MANRKSAQINRRDFLKYAGLGLSAAGASVLLQACGAPATPTAAPTNPPPPPTAVPPTAMPTAVPPTAVPPTAVPTAVLPTAVPPTLAPTAVPTKAIPTGQNLKMWWWGESEAPGLEKWLDESISLYQKATGNTIAPTQQTVDTVVSGFETAAAAKNAPDLQFFWNGIYHMEAVWLGYVQPLNGLVSDDLLKSSNASILSVFQGKQYRLGWYPESPLWVYNKDMFDKAGLNADQPPLTFDDLISACDKLKAKGFTPIVAGLKDGPWGEWFMGHGLTGNLDSPADALNLFAGELDWRDPKYHDHWDKLAQLWKAKYFNDDMNSVDLYPGIDMFGAGKGAMTALVVPTIAKEAGMLGSSKIGPMVFPISGKGKLNGKPIVDSAGLGICSQSTNQVVAADFLTFLHSSERISALWSEVSAMPMDTSWDGSAITDPLMQQVWKGWVVNPDAVPYISDLMPTLFWTDAMFVNSQKIIAGEYTGEQAAENAVAVTKKWRDQNPDMLANYKLWAKDLAF